MLSKEDFEEFLIREAKTFDLGTDRYGHKDTSIVLELADIYASGNEYPETLNEQPVARYLRQAQEIGGCEGGNHYGNYAEPYRNGDPKEFHFFEHLMARLYGDISLTDYIRARENLVERLEVREDGVYGNYRDMVVYRIETSRFYDWLLELGAISAPSPGPVHP